MEGENYPCSESTLTKSKLLIVISSKIARFQNGLLTCVKLRYCARDGGGTKGSVQLGKVRFVDSGDVPVVRHPGTI